MLKAFCRLLFVALLVGLGVPTSAAGPTVIMVYGGSLREPVVIVKASLDDYSFMSCMGPPGIDARQIGKGPYLKLAIFWKAVPEGAGPAKAFLQGLTPKAASQHGRLYLPTKTSAASVVVTDLSFTSVPSDLRTARDEPIRTFVALARPLPKDDKDFTKGCWLTPEHVQAARSVGIPGV